MVVDHRPRALAVLGVTVEEKADLRAHFAVDPLSPSSLRWMDSERISPSV